MNMKHLLSLLTAMSISIVSLAQLNGKISGTIKDGGNQQIIDAATISLLQSNDSSLVKAAVADKSGNYSFENINEGNYLVAASQHQDALKLYQLKRMVKNVRIAPDDISAVVIDKNNKSRKEEFYYGNSFLSQSSRFIVVDSSVQSVTIRNARGRTRVLNF